MTTADRSGRLVFPQRQADTRKADEILNLERRIDVTEKRIGQHSVIIEQYRHEAASRSAVLERRIKGLERLIVFLAEVLIALIAVVFAGLIAGSLGGGYLLPSSSLAACAFLVAFLGANLLFRKVASSCFR